MRLDEAFEAIITAIVQELEEEKEKGSDGLLEELETIIRGDRARPRPATPALWVFAEQANPSHDTSAIQESWELPVVITPVCKSDDPEDGYRQATRLASRARSVVMRNRTLGLRPTVQDIKSGRFEPSAPWHSDDKRSLFTAVSVVVVKFRIKEFC